MSFNRLEGILGILGWGIKSGAIHHDDESFSFRIAIEHEYIYNEFHDNDLDRLITEPIADSYSSYSNKDLHVVEEWNLYNTPSEKLDKQVPYMDALKHAKSLAQQIWEMLDVDLEEELLRKMALLIWLNGMKLDLRMYDICQMSVPQFHSFVSLLPMYRSEEDTFGAALAALAMPTSYIEGLFKQGI